MRFALLVVRSDLVHLSLKTDEMLQVVDERLKDIVEAHSNLAQKLQVLEEDVNRLAAEKMVAPSPVAMSELHDTVEVTATIAPPLLVFHMLHLLWSWI